MRKEINCFINRRYYELKKITKKITGNHQLSEDLLHEVLYQVLNRDEIKLNSYDDDTLTYYFVSIIRINWISKTSPFHYKIRREIDKYQEFSYTNEIEESQYDWEREHLIQAMEISFTELNFFQKGLMEMYMVLGSVNKVSQQTDIPKSSVIKSIRRAKDIIKENTLKRINDGMSLQE
jgi:DNA-directed RNA polymerase specialized sigma24 family protein